MIFVIGVNIVIDQMMIVGEKQFLLSPMVIHPPIQTVGTHSDDIVFFETVILVIILINVTIVIIVTRVIILIPFKRRAPCVDIVHGELVSKLDPACYSAPG